MSVEVLQMGFSDLRKDPIELPCPFHQMRTKLEGVTNETGNGPLPDTELIAHCFHHKEVMNV